MTLSKGDIVDLVSDKNGFSKKQSVDVVETLIRILKDSLISGDDVLISGFGKFCVNQKQERRGRNPATGKPMMLKARKIVTFRCSKNLRNQLNKNNFLVDEDASYKGSIE